MSIFNVANFDWLWGYYGAEDHYDRVNHPAYGSITTHKDEAIALIETAKSYIDQLETKKFPQKRYKARLQKEFSKILKLIESGELNKAYRKLTSNILYNRINGCARSGRPDKNDWIASCTAQNTVYDFTIGATEQLQQAILEDQELNSESTNQCIEEDGVYYTAGAKDNGCSQAYKIAVHTEGGFLDTGHAWIEMETTEFMEQENHESETLGFHPNGELHSKRGLIQEESGRNSQSEKTVVIYLTKEEYITAQDKADSYKSGCSYGGNNCSDGPWLSWHTYNTVRFTCASFVDRVVRAALPSLPSSLKRRVVPNHYVVSLNLVLQYPTHYNYGE